MPRAPMSGLFADSRRAGRIAMAAATAAFLWPASPLRAETELTASYAISIAGVPIGRADAKSRFTSTGYAAIIKGSTSGISRLVSDAQATLAGTGRIASDRVVPASYNLETSEGGFETHVRMSMQAGAITDLLAIPRLLEAPDRIRLTAHHKRDIVDPIAAFLIVTDRPGPPDGRTVCDRTLAVFDGWQRFDIGLAYKETRLATGTGNAYDGKVVVCSARYIPVAGHRTKREAVQYMAANKRLEIWYAPIGNLKLLAPYRILIGTQYGDLVIASTSFFTREAGSGVGN